MISTHAISEVDDTFTSANHASESFRNHIIFKLPSMSPGELIGVDSPTPIVTAVKASTDVEVQAALGSSTDDTTTTGAPVEKVRICLFSSPAGDQASRWAVCRSTPWVTK